MKTLKSSNVSDNIHGKTFKTLEKKYIAATQKLGVVRAKCVVTVKFSGLVEGAVLGFDKNEKIIVANAFSTYCGNDMVVMVKVHKYDFLITDAIKAYQA